MSPPKKKAPAKKAPAKKKAAEKQSPAEPAPEEEVAHETSVPPTFDDDLFDDDLWGADWSDLGADPGQDDAAADFADGGDASHQLASDGVELFQHAALELIAAARNALDAAEELVADPRVIGTTLESLRDIASETLRAARPVVRPRTGRPPRDDDPDDYQAIRVDDG